MLTCVCVCGHEEVCTLNCRHARKAANNRRPPQLAVELVLFCLFGVTQEQLRRKAVN